MIELKKISSEDLLQELIDRKVLFPLGYRTFGLVDSPNGEAIMNKIEDKIHNMPIHEFHLQYQEK